MRPFELVFEKAFYEQPLDDSDVARWLRNKWYEKACPYCRVPGWKLQKYSQASFIKEKKYD